MVAARLRWGSASLLAAFEAAPEPPGLGLANELKEAESPTSTIESRSLIHEPSANAAWVACGYLRVICEPELLQAFEQREAGVEESSALAALGAFVHLGFEQRCQVRDRCLLLAGLPQRPSAETGL